MLSFPQSIWLLSLTGILVAFVILWKVPQWQVSKVRSLDSKEKFDRVNEARKTLAQIFGGIVLMVGLFATWQNFRLAQESLAVSQQGQITDRFTKAIEQLGATDSSGHKKMELRLGGIYALERIANDSERDHWPIMEVLCTYVRENAPRAQPEMLPTSPPQVPINPSDDSSREIAVRIPLAPDIQAILTVLGRRNLAYEPVRRIHFGVHGSIVEQRPPLDLRHTDLRWAKLARADLTGAILGGADLRHALLGGSFLENVLATRADLSNASFYEADMKGAILVLADLGGADLENADLSAADCREANFLGARLDNADLSGATLDDAVGLTQVQVNSAKGNRNTTLPGSLTRPTYWGK